MLMNKPNLATLAAVTLTVLLGGWLLTAPPEDGTELLAQVNRMQQDLLGMSHQLTETSRELVTADAQARRELTELQRELEAERRNIDQRRDELEVERRELARQRHRDPLLAAALIQSVTLILACLPLVLIVLLLRQSAQQPGDGEACELLITEYLPVIETEQVTPSTRRLTSDLSVEPLASEANRLD